MYKHTAHLVLILAAMWCTLFCEATNTCSEDDDECGHTVLLQMELKHNFRKEAYENLSACLDAILPLLEDDNADCKDQCGDIFRDPEQVNTYTALGSNPDVENICETGFWKGRSSAMWLCSNPTAKLHSFDLSFPENNMKAIKKFFGDRFTNIVGDTLVTLPEFAKDPNSPFCDIMVADGGHFDEVPWSDLNNFAKIAAKQPDRNHFLIVDEIYFYRWHAGCCMDVTDAYEKALRLDMIDTSSGFCKSLVCTNAGCSEGPAQTFPLVGEETLKTTYPKGGYCAVHFATEFLKTLE